MYVVLLRFSSGKDKAAEFMAGHQEWLDRGFAENVFLMAGSLAPGLGGAVLARGVSRQSLDERLREDPFVAEGVVATEVHEVAPARACEQFAFLLPAPPRSIGPTVSKGWASRGMSMTNAKQ